MSADREFEAVKSCWLLLSPLVPAARQYQAELQLLKRHIAARDAAGNLASAGSSTSKPIADKLRGLVDKYFNRFWDFQAAARTAIDTIAGFQPFSRTIRELKGKIDRYRRGQIGPTSQAVLQAEHELSSHPFSRQTQQELAPFEVAPLLTEDEIKAIEAQIEEVSKNLSMELAEIHAKNAAELQESEADRLKLSGDTSAVEPDRTGPAASGRKHGPAPDMDRHCKIAATVKDVSGSGDWCGQVTLHKIAAELDRQKAPIPKAWKEWSPAPPSWKRAVEYHADRVIKAIDYSLKMAAR